MPVDVELTTIWGALLEGVPEPMVDPFMQVTNGYVMLNGNAIRILGKHVIEH
ncbi:hypothetical protein GCM10011533_01840 [Streptosporangium jomthongense]|nr:hypothetical protein GCM10011533_01840 [Streptosporangium jomthongense]